ncbi:MAG: 16S rRNA (guanine(527)-N(7))-methyltransferase RsmG [Alphaproteobacteria bacterium]|nr:16S rRNA (guanine(527)-N(7))-methyltransferase RsmG [Alphaproteobacteria bacterium]
MDKNVSRETFEKLKVYQQTLETWQKKLNLISSSTLPHIWERHFEDSLQLLPYLPLFRSNLVDLGSGAGFPGLVLAITRPDFLNVTLIESDLKKCVFLENVSRETNTPVTILNERIEALKKPLKFNIIVARGLAPLSLLIDYAVPLMDINCVCLFLKGKEYENEIENSRKKWDFNLELFPSLTDSRGRILKITHPKKVSSYDKNNSSC